MKRLVSFAIILILVLGIFSSATDAQRVYAASKISAELHETFDSLNSSTTTSVCVEFEDVDHMAVMEEFERRYPEECAAYMLAKSETAPPATTDAQMQLLQRALERKREIYREFYSALNAEILDGVVDSDELLFSSEYAPIAVVEASETLAMEIAGCASVIAVSEAADIEVELATESDWREGMSSEEFVQHLDLSNQITRTDILRDTYGLKGDYIKIGIVEAEGIPDITDEYLQNMSITAYPGDTVVSEHATAVTLILAAQKDGVNHGIVPNADYYCAITPDFPVFFTKVEWLITQGVNIINASLNGSHDHGVYDIRSQWVDHIISVHDVHFVVTAGNNTVYVRRPAMAYNAITVGAFSKNGSDDVADFQMASYSAFHENIYLTNRPEKPNLVANGYFGDYIDLDGDDIVDYCEGTSFAAPQVAGAIAQLCGCDGNLLFRQSVVGALLAASAAEKVEAVGNGYKGDSFISSVRVTGAEIAPEVYEEFEQISDKEGAGILDARWAWGIIANGNYWYLKLDQEDFPYEKTISVSASSGLVYRIAIYWIKYNQDVNCTTGDIGANNIPLANLDLYVYDSNGNEVAHCSTLTSNFEIVQFVPTVAGTYTIKIVLNGTTDITEHIGLAVW